MYRHNKQLDFPELASKQHQMSREISCTHFVHPTSKPKTKK